MITKSQIAAEMGRDCDIAKHVFSKLPAESHDYKPTPEQRSTTELLRYLAICGIAGIRSLDASNWKVFGEYVARVADMKPEDFPAAMDRQKAEILAFFDSVTEETLETKDAKLPLGDTMKLGPAILGLPFKWIPAYKLQLFLYAKSCGCSTINTANAWMGIDWKR